MDEIDYETLAELIREEIEWELQDMMMDMRYEYFDEEDALC